MPEVERIDMSLPEPEWLKPATRPFIATPRADLSEVVESGRATLGGANKTMPPVSQGTAVSGHNIQARPRPERPDFSRSFRARVSPETERMLRQHYLERIGEQIRSMAPLVGAPEMTGYARRILDLIRDEMGALPNDPFNQMLASFRNAMIIENRMFGYTEEQYDQAFELLLRAASGGNSFNQYSKYLKELQLIGFDPFPALDFGIEDEEDEED